MWSYVIETSVEKLHRVAETQIICRLAEARAAEAVTTDFRAVQPPLPQVFFRFDAQLFTASKLYLYYDLKRNILWLSLCIASILGARKHTLDYHQS